MYQVVTLSLRQNIGKTKHTNYQKERKIRKKTTKNPTPVNQQEKLQQAT